MGWGDFQTEKTHCPQGHLYDEWNTFHYPLLSSHKYRICRTCKRIACKEYNRRRRERMIESLKEKI